jgi:GTP cyclohydrolase IA
MRKKSKKMRKPSPATTHFPSPILKDKPNLSDEEKIRLIAEHFREIMDILGLDLSNGSLSKSPERIAKMYVQEVFAGLNEANFPEISFFNDDYHHEHKAHMVFTKVGFISFCEHHFVPMTGFAYVAYLPNKQLIGLSKISRLVRFFACRPQLQERLTAQIADSLAMLLQMEDVAVSINARHECVRARGIQDQNNQMITNVLRGQFNSDDNLRREFFETICRQNVN